MHRIWAALMVPICLATSCLTTRAEEVPDAELKQILVRLETKVERLSAQGQAQRAEIARLRAVFAPQPVAAPVAALSGLYSFAIKDANSLLGALTDSELGTQSNTNIRSHHFRVDLGLASFLQWQNLLFISNSRRSSNPAERFFVPFQRGARETVRFQSFLAFAF